MVVRIYYVCVSMCGKRLVCNTMMFMWRIWKEQKKIKVVKPHMIGEKEDRWE